MQRGSRGRPNASLSSVSLCLLLLTLSGSAAAQKIVEQESQPRRVAVLGIEASELPAQSGLQATAAIRTLISSQSDLLLVAREAVTLGEALLTYSCIDESAACIAAIGEELGAQVLLYGRLRSTRDQQVHMVLHAIDVPEKRALGMEDGVFDPTQLEEGATRLCSRLLSRRTATQGRIVLTILQAGAIVFLNGRRVDQAPLAMPLLVEAGTHRLRITLDGFREEQLILRVKEGEVVKQTVDLEPLPEEPPPPAEVLAPAGSEPKVEPEGEAEVSNLRILSWGLLGSGLITLAAGITYSVLTHETQQQFEETQFQRKASELKETGESYARTARVLYGVSGALILSGAILLLTDREDPPAPATKPTAGLKLAPLGLSGEPGPVWGLQLQGAFP